MSEPRKTRAQLDAQLGRISTAVSRAMNKAEDYDEMMRVRNRWFSATDAYGKLSGDNKKIDAIKDYRPKDRHFTSREEIEYLDKKLGLSKRSVESLNALRNNVVEAYDRYAGEDRRLGSEYMPWMQSITAVIDHFKIRKGGRV